MTGIVVSFGRVSGRRTSEVTDALTQLLVLAQPVLLRCEVGFRAQSRGLLAVVHLREAPPPPLVSRLAFWCARAGGLALELSEVTPATRASIAETLARSDVRRAIGPEGIAAAVAELAVAGGLAGPARAPARRPVLRLAAGGPGWDAVTYDPAARHLFVPSPLAPPVGDEFDLLVGSAGRDGLVAVGHARTVAVRPPAEASRDAPAGFCLRVEGQQLHQLLSRSCRRFVALGARSAPRYRVAGRVQVDPPASAPCEQFLENLSHTGAFIRTRPNCRPGTRVSVELPLAHGEALAVPATIVRVEADGIGVAFQGDAASRARLDAAITELTAGPRRVVVVDDDELSRRMLADGLRERGFEVVAEPDALAGLSRLAEELLTIDLLVTDVLMPEVDGEELVRRIRQVGGERDLPILAVTARLDEEVVRRLKLAGADAVVSKALGPERLADAAEALLKASDEEGRGAEPGERAGRRPARGCQVR